MQKILPLILSILSILSTSSAGQISKVPYHPYRKVADKYYGLQPIYDWIKLPDAARAKKERPMPAWKGGPCPDQLYGQSYKVLQIVSEGIIVEQAFYPLYSGRSFSYGNPFLLVNFPDKGSLVDGDYIEFLALADGNYSYTGADHATHTIPKYDYGIPYNPSALKPASPVAGK